MTRRVAAWTFILAVAASGLVATALPAHAGGGGCHEAQKTEMKGSRVVIEGLCFKPTVVHIVTGGLVTWLNKDPVVHAVTGAAQSFGDYTGLGPGQEVTHTFKEAGTYPYFCYFHPGMAGTVVVGGDTVPLQSAGASRPADSRAGRRLLILAYALAMAAIGLGTGYVIGRSAR